MNVIDEMETVKVEMGELYDYFDHFEREEDTLMQQVQRQLNDANRYCKILQYRLEKYVKFSRLNWPYADVTPHYYAVRLADLY